MIASVDKEADITIYLNPEEINKLQQEQLSGTLIKQHKPEQQGIINLYYGLNPEIDMPAFGIGVELDIRTPRADVFLTPDVYEHFVENRRYGTRYGHIGSKISLKDISRMKRIDITMGPEQLEWYRDNMHKMR